MPTPERVRTVLSPMLTLLDSPSQEITEFVRYITTRKMQLLEPTTMFFLDNRNTHKLGCYYDKDNCVSMYDTAKRKDQKYFYHTIAHELRHAEQYQHKLMPIPKGRSIRLERDADKYAEIWVWDYFYDKAQGLI